MSVQQSDPPRRQQGRDDIYPLQFEGGPSENMYMDDAAVRALAEFFEEGLAVLKG